MPRFRHNPDTGQVYQFKQGRWAEISPLEADIAQAGAAGQALSFMAGASPLSAFTEAGRAAMDVNPVAANLPLAGGVAWLGARPLGRMAGRVLGKIEQGAQTARAGGTGLRTPSGMLKRPQDMVPEELSGVVRGMEAGVEAAPGLRLLTDQIRLQRQRVAGNALGRWLGVPEETLSASKNKLLPDVVEDALSTTDEMYTSISNAMTRTIKRDQFDEMLEEAVERKLLIPEKASQYKELIDSQGRSVGDSVIALRSELRGMARNASDETARQHTEMIIQNIQKVIDSALEGTPESAIAKLADTRYARWMLLKNTSAIRQDGTVSRAALTQALKRNDARTILGNRKGQDPETDALVQAMKDWGQLGAEMPSSGTAERTAAYDALIGIIGLGTGAAIF